MIVNELESMLTIKASGTAHPAASGTEIVLLGIILDFSWHDASDIFDHSWLKEGSAYRWRCWDNHGIGDITCAQIPQAEQVILVFEKNRWRGICEAEYRQKKYKIDCYSDSDQSGCQMAVLTDSMGDTVSMAVRIKRWCRRKQDIYYEKKLCVFGDSYAANHCRPYTEAWHFLFALKHRMEYHNYGINGNGLAGRASGTVPMTERYEQMPEDADFIFVMGGKNDYNIQLDLKFFRGGVQRLFQGMLRRFTRARIVFFTPWKIAADDEREDPKQIKLSAYRNVILEECGRYGILVFDASRSNICVWKKQFRLQYMQGPEDVSHLNAEGHRRMLEEAERFLLYRKCR